MLGLYGLGLLLAPATFSAFWPWRLDSFHGQMYSAVFLTGVVTSATLYRAAAPIELFTAGLSQALLGGLAILGLIVVDAAVHRVNWSAPGTWLWLGAFAVIALAGAAMVTQALAASRPQTEPQPSHA